MKTLLVLIAVVLVGLLAVYVWSGFRSDTIIDCAPGFHLVNGTCVPDEPNIVTTTITLAIGQASPSGLFTLNGVFTDRVTGLQCYEYPIGNCSPGSAQHGSAVSMTIGQQVSNGCTVTVKLMSIDYYGQKATFEQSVDNTPNKPCPICWWQLEAMDTTTATKQ